jgi:hypothetical protein
MKRKIYKKALLPDRLGSGSCGEEIPCRKQTVIKLHEKPETEIKVAP